MGAALLQVEDRNGPVLAVLILGLFAVFGLYWMWRTRQDRRAGRLDEEATYVLTQGTKRRLQVVRAGSQGRERPCPFGAASLERLVKRIEHRDDMVVTNIVLETGEELPYSPYKGALDTLAAVVLTDSRGLVRVEADGWVIATPPLDRGVRRDLEELLGDVIETDGPARTHT